MIRKLLLPALTVALLGGCVSGYGYRPAGSGGYYYGQPSVEYRYYGGYGYPYGGSRYGYYNYNRPGWGYPYYGYPGYYPRPPIVVRPPHRPDHPHKPDHPGRPDRPDHPDVGDGGNRPPWRDLDNINRREVRPPRMVPQQPVSRPSV
ncbi:hypothetical protein, partial [Marilutibacter aestuarii]